MITLCNLLRNIRLIFHFLMMSEISLSITVCFLWTCGGVCVCNSSHKFLFPFLGQRGSLNYPKMCGTVGYPHKAHRVPLRYGFLAFLRKSVAIRHREDILSGVGLSILLQPNLNFAINTLNLLYCKLTRINENILFLCESRWYSNTHSFMSANKTMLKDTQRHLG